MSDGAAFEQKLEDLRKRFRRRGACSWHPGSPLRTTLRQHDVPEEPGVYVLATRNESTFRIVYVGHGGTYRNDGGFSEQGLRGRLSAKASNGMPREQDYRRRLAEDSCAELRIEWFVTWDEATKILPSSIEGELIQAYMDDHGSLPAWNEEF